MVTQPGWQHCCDSAKDLLCSSQSAGFQPKFRDAAGFRDFGWPHCPGWRDLGGGVSHQPLQGLNDALKHMKKSTCGELMLAPQRLHCPTAFQVSLADK